MITQLAKMIFLATVFPVPLDEDDDDPNAEIPFDFLMVRIKLLYILHCKLSLLKSRFFDKATKFEKISHLF